MTLLSQPFLPCVPSSPVCLPSVLSWKNQCQSWRLLSIYPSWLLMTPSLLFLLFIYHAKTFLPPLFTVQWQLHPWLDRECAAAKTRGLIVTPRMFSCPYLCLYIYLCEITSCNIWLWECQRFSFSFLFLVVWFIKTVSLLPFPPPAMFSGCISPCIRLDLNIKTWAISPTCWIDKTVNVSGCCLDEHISCVTCRLLYAMCGVFKCPFTAPRPSMLRVLHVSCLLLESPLLPFVKFFDNTFREGEVDSELLFFYVMKCVHKIE